MLPLLPAGGPCRTSSDAPQPPAPSSRPRGRPPRLGSPPAQPPHHLDGQGDEQGSPETEQQGVQRAPLERLATQVPEPGRVDGPEDRPGRVRGGEPGPGQMDGPGGEGGRGPPARNEAGHHDDGGAVPRQRPTGPIKPALGLVAPEQPPGGPGTRRATNQV